MFYKYNQLRSLYSNPGIAHDVLERWKQQMSEFPVVPTFLNKVDYGPLPSQVVDVLEQSGVVGYLTASGEGAEQSFKALIQTCVRAVSWSSLSNRIEAELFIRAMTTGWTRIALDELETNSCASTADEYYKGLFAAKNDAPVDNPAVTTTGMRGFQESPKAEDWDLAIGVIKGFRKWHIQLPTKDDPNPILKGSYGKDYLQHDMLEDGRRVGVCHANSGNHPAEQVPADNGCGCGWWAYWSPQEAKKHSSGGDTDRSVAVTIAVEGSGRVVIGQKGFRSQYLKISGIAPDDAEDPAKMARIKQFSRDNLLDAPVYAGVEELYNEVGGDPLYGTLGARYPELSNHTDQALSIYVMFLTNLKADIENFLVVLQEKLNSMKFSEHGIYNPSNQNRTEEESQFSYLKVTCELLGSEAGIVQRIVGERGSTVVDVLDAIRDGEIDLG